MHDMQFVEIMHALVSICWVDSNDSVGCWTQVEANANALVVSTENITQNWYAGDNRSMLIPNTLFRMGASAVILTNRRASASPCGIRLPCFETGTSPR